MLVAFLTYMYGSVDYQELAPNAWYESCSVVIRTLQTDIDIQVLHGNRGDSDGHFCRLRQGLAQFNQFHELWLESRLHLPCTQHCLLGLRVRPHSRNG